MLYVMFFGRYPFETPPAGVPKAKEILEMLDKMVTQKYTIPEPNEITLEVSSSSWFVKLAVQPCEGFRRKCRL